MKRFILDELIKWKNDITRKPLILKGARQVGKTYILKYFGNKFYEDVAYFNFDHDEGLHNLFLNTKDPKRILDQLSLVHGKAILPRKTLIIFDEIQECSNALNSLKYFYEEANDYHVACAGSLLGIRLSHTSFPVGKVDFLQMNPMSFSEFLIADHSENLVQYMKSIHGVQELSSIFTDQLEEKLKIYFIVGGMPEAVFSWVNFRDIEKVNSIQDAILQSYEHDFSKHISNAEANKVSLIWNGIPSQLAKENKKFIYQVVKEGARAREYESALNWLNDANLIYKVSLCTKPSLPLKSYVDLSSFKIYMNDVGLLRKMSGLDSKIILENNDLFEEFKGSFSENYVLNMLMNSHCFDVYYYTFDSYEVDFLLQFKNTIIPIEVKSNRGKHHASLTRYNESYHNSFSIRISMQSLKYDGAIMNIPLYLVEYIDQFIS